MLYRIQNPRTIVRLAAACIALFGILGIPSVGASFGDGVRDGARGALLGAAVALLFVMFRQRRLDKGAP